MVKVHKEIYVCDKPMVVVDYNRGKYAVDLSDQMIAYYTPHRRTPKWCIKLALELLLNTSISNKQQKQKSRYQILEWHSQCTLHSAIRQRP